MKDIIVEEYPMRPVSTRFVTVRTCSFVLAVLAVLVGAAAGQASGEQADVSPAVKSEKPSAEGGTTSESTGAAVATEDISPEDIVADENKWLVDEEWGKEYRIVKIPKVEGTFLWSGKDRIVLPMGATRRVLKHDDEWFWIKEFKAVPRIIEQRQEEEEPELPDPRPTPKEIEVLHDVKPDTGGRLGFIEFDRGLPRGGQWRNGFEMADMNGDGHLDIVSGPPRKSPSPPVIFLGDGEGGWTHWSEARFPSDLPYDYGDTAVGDFNGDGHPDLAMGIHLRGMLVLVADGKGTFTAWSEGIDLRRPGRGSDDSGFSSRVVETIDWNGDGHLDLLALGEGPKAPKRKDGKRMLTGASRGFLVYLNRGDGSWMPWNPRRPDATQKPVFGDDFVVADLNGDGHTDLVSSSRMVSSKEILRIGTGDGRFTIAEIEAVRPVALVTSVELADLDGDAHKDLILGYLSHEGGEGVWTSGIDLLYGQGDLTWTAKPLYSEQSRRPFSAIRSGNLDGDGRADLVALTGNGEVWVLLGDGEGSFVRSPVELTRAQDGCEGFGLHLVDLDGDGLDEVIAGFAGEKTGYPGIPELFSPGCVNEGSLRAWKPVLGSAPAPDPAG